jgi:hypothetical protein
MMSPFVMLDSYQPLYKLDFNRDSLQYEMIETGEYEDNVFTFDINELRIKYFCSASIYIKLKEVSCTLITFNDDSQIYCKLALKDFIKEFLTEYIIKLNESYINIQSE